MNQILSTKLNFKNNKNYKKKIILQIQLFLSILLILLLILTYLFYRITLKNKEYLSYNLLSNYEISKIYTSSLNDNFIDSNIDTSENKNINYPYLGNLSIPSLNIFYPVFLEFNNENLDLSLCKFYGSLPNVSSNLCIVGHNYDNHIFFSDLNDINLNDEIFIINNSNITYTYIVFDIYEVEENDISPIYNTTYKYELTLITCNNKNDKRLIVKAKQISNWLTCFAFSYIIKSSNSNDDLYAKTSILVSFFISKIICFKPSG